MVELEDIEDGKLLPLVEDFYSIQGEGFHSGKPAYFIRLAGCNVGCRWCDAKVTWSAKSAPKVTVEQIVERVKATAATHVVITGGEPLLHPLEPLTSRLKDAGLEILLETSGSAPISGHFDWICLSPKRWREPLEQAYKVASELKVIITNEDDLHWAELCAERVTPSTMLFLQPEWGHFDQVTPMIIEYAKSNPKWNISMQTHKFMNIP